MLKKSALASLKPRKERKKEMEQNSNPDIQKILDEAQSVKADDPDMLEKLNQIAQRVAEEQKKNKPSSAGLNNTQIIDPAEELGCEGCQ